MKLFKRIYKDYYYNNHIVALLSKFVQTLTLCYLLSAISAPLVFGWGAMSIMGGSDTVVETEAGFTEFWWSGADGQSWFGGDNLAADLFDAGKGIFTSGTYSWTVYGTNTIANVSNALAITWVDDAAGAHLEWSDAEDLSSDLTIGQLYKFGPFDASINTGSAEVHVYNQAGSSIDSVTVSLSTAQSFTIYFVATHATGDSIRIAGLGAGEVLTLDNLTLQAVTSPADFADTGAFIRVCDSGGTDAVNCATGYIGEAGSGETLGGELITTENDRTFAGAGNWTPTGTATLTTNYDSGDAGYDSVLRIEAGDATLEGADLPDIGSSATINKNFKSAFAYKDVETTNITPALRLRFLGGVNNQSFDLAISTSWLWKVQHYIPYLGTANPRIIIYTNRNAGHADNETLIENISFKEVTEPNPNSVMILKTPGGTEGWLTIGATFDPNDISTFIISQ